MSLKQERFRDVIAASWVDYDTKIDSAFNALDVLISQLNATVTQLSTNPDFTSADKKEWSDLITKVGTKYSG
jgi:hypothetical protein